MITFYNSLKSALRVSGVTLALYAGTKLVCALAGYASVSDAIADSVLAASVFGGTAYEVLDTRRANRMTLNPKSIREE